jgi:23S rRNA (cytidine1920-2'-O)/16S rRNA (cytidine1409-2'-O)-methyltransferase
VARRRLDAEMVRRGLVASRAEAQEAVRAGLVTVGGSTASKPASMVADDDPVAISSRARKFVSRGGEKLSAALDRFAVEPAGMSCLDLGASTGGFTDCLLRAGAARVAAVDVGYGQLAWRLRQDPRVAVLERTNARDLLADDMPFVPGLVAADLSFISLRTVLPAVVPLASPSASFVVLVKPQFEAGRADVGKGGVVRDPGAWRRSLEGVVASFSSLGVSPLGVMASPLLGPSGNAEFLMYAVARAEAPALDMEAPIAEASAMTRDRGVG